MSMFPMTGYKIDISTDFLNNDFNFGIDPNNTNLSDNLVNKINSGLKKFGVPWKNECIPYYKDTFFVWITKEYLESFLFGYCELNEEDLQELKNKGYKLYSFSVNAISRGLSKVRGTCFIDEISNVEQKSFNILDNTNNEKFTIYKYSADNVNNYYTNVNIFFN